MRRAPRATLLNAPQKVLQGSKLQLALNGAALLNVRSQQTYIGGPGWVVSGYSLGLNVSYEQNMFVVPGRSPRLLIETGCTSGVVLTLSATENTVYATNKITSAMGDTIDR